MNFALTFSRTFSPLLLLVFLSPMANALEVYTFITEKCDIKKGLPIDVTENTSTILDLEGATSSIENDSITFVLIHNTVDNPYTRISIDEASKAHLRTIYIGEKTEPAFTGWPVKFVEDLIGFFDVNGRYHIVNLESIRRIDDLDEDSSLKSNKKLKANPVQLSTGDIGTNCIGNKTGSGKSIVPTKIYADKVQISELLSQFNTGFNKIRSYQERTHLYPRPMMFKTKTRLGFSLADDLLENGQLPGNVYFQWGSGEKYRFQNFNQIGFVPVELLPSIEPFGVVRTDLKSHLFHATFIGNIAALPAGTEFYSINAFPEDADDKLKPKFTDEVHTSANLNYLALMGIDWGHWSFSVGNYYPTFYFQVKDQFREILASSATPLFRVKYTTKKWLFRGTFSSVAREEDTSPSDSQLVIDTDISVIGQVNRFKMDSFFLRGGVERLITDELMVGAEVIWLKGNYEETLASTAENFIDFDHYTAALLAEKEFGDYVNLKAFLKYQLIERDYRFNGLPGDEGEEKVSLGGQFEFIF